MLLALGWLGAGGIREDEFQCEQAVAHLEECCPGFEPREVSCSFSSGCGSTTFTAFSLEESRCIQEESCGAIRSGHVCERAAAREPSETSVEDGGAAIETTPEQEPVCP
jgi:hypothetical protein